MSKAKPDRASVARVIRDPVHDYVDLPIELNALVDHPLLQRLRRVSQTAMCATVYPSMTGTRFEHVLGSMHLAGRAWESAWSNSPSIQQRFQDDVFKSLRRDAAMGLLDDFTKSWVSDKRGFRRTFSISISHAIQAAALLHDVGHTPFSHALEDFYARHLKEIVADVPMFHETTWRRLIDNLPNRPFHEIVGLALLEYFDPADVSAIPWTVVKRITTAKVPGLWPTCLHDLVSGEVDIDRFDYLLRDTQRSGTEFGAFDRERLVQSTEIHRVNLGHGPEWKVGFGIRATSALESFLSQRLQYYRWVVFHPHAVASNRLLILALERMIRLGRLTTYGPPDSETEASARLRQLNYFALASEPTSDLDLLSLAEVDDSTIIEQLKTARRAVAARGEATKGRRGEREFLAFAGAVLHRTPNWAPVWKTDYDYVKIADEMAPALITALESVENDIRADSAIALSEKGDSLSLNQLRVQLRQVQNALANFAGAAANSSAAVTGLNHLARALLRGEGAQQRINKESLFARRLLPVHKPRDLPDGMWVLAYEELVAVREDESGVGVFEGERYHQLSHVSATIEGLDFIESRRPRFFAYYMTVEEKPMRIDRQSLYAEELRGYFVAAFPSAVAEMYRSMAL